jgi:WG containing repeat
MAAGVRWSVVALSAVLLAHAAIAQEQQTELTPTGKATLQSALTGGGRSSRTVSPQPTCMFRGGLCGAVRGDGTVAVPPRYDWVGRFSEGRAAIRLGGLYGFVDEDGREIVEPKYRIVDDYRFGFAQVNVDGKSGLIDRDGRMVIAPKYGRIAATGPDRFRVSDARWLGEKSGLEGFYSGRALPLGWRTTELMQPPPMALHEGSGVIDISGQWIEPPRAKPKVEVFIDEQPAEPRDFDKDNPSIRWAWRNNLWGLQRHDGSWLVEPKFQQADRLIGELTRVMLNGKVGFIDREGNLAIEPVFDKVWPFHYGFDRTAAVRDGVPGVIDKTGAWVSQAGDQQIPFAITFTHNGFPDATDDNSETIRGWYFRKGDRWGLLDSDGRVVLDADFDMPVEHCDHGTLVASKNQGWLRFKWDGSPLQPPNGRFVDGTCWSPFTLKIGDKFGLVAADGSPMTPIHFDAVARAGYARNVKLGGRWGRVAGDGRWLIEPKFDYLSADEGLLVAAVDGKRGFLNLDGSWLIEPKFDSARLMEGRISRLHRRPDPDSAFVTISGATGLLRLKGEAWAIPPRPGVMCNLVSTNDSATNVIIWQTGSKLVALSASGEIWFDIDADRIGPVRESGLFLFLRNGKWGLVDTAGEVTVEPQYDELDGFVRGIAWAKRGERWCAIDRRGRAVPSIACTDAVPTPPPLPLGPCPA